MAGRTFPPTVFPIFGWACRILDRAHGSVWLPESSASEGTGILSGAQPVRFKFQYELKTLSQMDPARSGCFYGFFPPAEARLVK